jgi:hypothetical protein
MKTYKREVAVIVLFYLGYLGLFGRVEALEVLSWPFMLFVGAAFGMEWASRQTDLVIRKKEKDDFNEK